MTGYLSGLVGAFTETGELLVRGEATPENSLVLLLTGCGTTAGFRLLVGYIGGELYESVGVEAPILLSYTHKNEWNTHGGTTNTVSEVRHGCFINFCGCTTAKWVLRHPHFHTIIHLWSATIDRTTGWYDHPMVLVIRGFFFLASEHLAITVKHTIAVVSSLSLSFSKVLFLIEHPELLRGVFFGCSFTSLAFKTSVLARAPPLPPTNNPLTGYQYLSEQRKRW